MDIMELKHFMGLAKIKNFTKAAESMFITQSALSKQIKQLETQLGVKLFLKSGHSIVLTPAGEILYQDGNRILEMYGGMVENIKQASRNYQGEFRLSCTDGYNDFQRPVIRMMHRSLPNIKITMHPNVFEDVKNSLLENRIDFAFTYQFIVQNVSSIKWRRLYQDELVAIMSKDYHLLHKGISHITLGEMQAEPILSFDGSLSDNVFHNMPQFSSLTQNFNYISNKVSFDNYWLMAEAGLGISIGAKYPIHYYEELTSLELMDMASQLDFGIGWNAQSTNPFVSSFANEFL